MIRRDTWAELAKESEYQIQEARKRLRHDSPKYKRIEGQHNRLMNMLHENRPHADNAEGGVGDWAALDTLYTYYGGKPWCALTAYSYPIAVVGVRTNTERHPDNPEPREAS